MSKNQKTINAFFEDAGELTKTMFNDLLDEATKNMVCYTSEDGSSYSQAYIEDRIMD